MKTVVLIASIFLMSQLKAQDSWVVFLNKQQLLSTSTESAEKNVFSVKEEDLKENHPFTLTYFDLNKEKDWTRFLMIFTTKDEEIKRQEGRKMRLTNSRLLELLKKHKELHFYTYSLPNDPDLRARIRVRRIHLCTLVLD